MFGAAFGFFNAQVSLGEVFQLDVGDTGSYGGSGQTFANLLNNPADGELKTEYDTYRGATASIESIDPVFNGTAGNKSANEFWSFGIPGYFTKKTANSTFMESMHKNNAKFTMMFAIKTGASATSDSATFFNTNRGGNNGTGIIFYHLLGVLGIQVGNSSGSAFALDVSAASSTLSNSTTHIMGISLDEATGDLRFYLDGTTETIASSFYVSPGAGAATHTLRLFTGASSGDIGKIYQIMVSEQAFTDTEFDEWRNRYLSRY